MRERADKLIVETDSYVSSAEIEAGDPRAQKLNENQIDRTVPYIPTDQAVVNKMLEVAKVTRDDVLYDLGCGDGRIVITAAKLGARAVGVEIDLALLRSCHDNLKNTAARDRVEFRRESFFDVDLTPATVVTLYLLPAINRRLRPKLLWELRPGARIVANYFEIADWKPDEQILFKHRPIMLWIVPAWVAGTYKCTFTGPDGAPPRRHAMLELKRDFQFLTGSLQYGKTRVPVTGRVRGTEVTIDVPACPLTNGPARLVASYHESELRGHHVPAGNPQGAQRVAGHLGIFIAQREAAIDVPPTVRAA